MADPLRLARALQVVARGLGKVGRERAHTCGVTPQQADALELLDAPNTVSTSSFAHLLGIDPSTASRNLASLQRAGLIARKRDGDDGRQTEVRLTPKGRRVAENLAAETLRVFGVLLDRVPGSERARVTDGLELLALAVMSTETRS